MRLFGSIRFKDVGCLFLILIAPLGKVCHADAAIGKNVEMEEPSAVSPEVGSAVTRHEGHLGVVPFTSQKVMRRTISADRDIHPPIAEWSREHPLFVQGQRHWPVSRAVMARG